jgi:hypothetical protein
MASEALAVKQESAVMRRGGLIDRYFYFGISLLVAAVVVYGFSHTIDENLIHAVPARPWMLWAHGILFSGWVAFFILQSTLVRTGNVQVHRTLGWFGVGMGTLITLVGISTAIVMDRFHFFQSHDAAAKVFFAIQLQDMVAFTTAFWLAVYWRKKPQLHRRLMLIATCVLTAAAFARIPHFGVATAYLGVDGLIFLGVVRDLIVDRKVHVVYRYALPALAVWQTFMVQTWLQHPAWWVRITDAIMS